MVKFVLNFDSEKLLCLLPDSVIKSEDTHMITAISIRYIETEELPRAGDYLMYPVFNLEPALQHWMHTKICFKVDAVLHNPIQVTPFSDAYSIKRENNEFNTVLFVTPQLLPTQN